ADLYEVQDDPPGALAALVSEAVEEAFGLLGQGAAHAAELPVALVGQGGASTQGPEPMEGVAEEGQAAPFAGRVADHAVGEPVGEAYPCAPRHALDGFGEGAGVHRAYLDAYGLVEAA